MAEDWSNIHPAWMAMVVERAMLTGDLRPLVAYLRSDLRMEQNVRKTLADLVEGVGSHEYKVTAERDGHAARKQATARLDFDIALFVERLLKEKPGRDAAKVEAAMKFGVSQSRVRDALRAHGEMSALDILEVFKFLTPEALRAD